MERAEIIGIVEDVVGRVLTRIGGERRYVRIATAAIWYDFEARELRDRCVRGEIPGAVKDGKEWRIPVTSLERMMREGERQTRKKHKRKGVRMDAERGIDVQGGNEGGRVAGKAEGEAAGVCGR